MAVSLAALALAVRWVAKDLAGAWMVALTAPAAILTLAIGQATLIFAALMILALEAIRTRRPVMAGLAIALLTIKPQLKLTIPIILITNNY